MTEITLLGVFFFVAIGVFLSFYAILDGFDLGVGMLYAFARSEGDKSMIKNSVGPFWGANEVWLVATLASLFGAYPLAYGSLLSSFYLAIMLLLWSLMLRGVSFEFRNQLHSKIWKTIWDFAFVLGSFLITLILGVAIGNILVGLHLGTDHFYTGSFLDLFNPLALLIAVFIISVFLTHGATFLLARTEGNIKEKIDNLFNLLWICYVALFVILSLVLIVTNSSILENYNSNTILWIIPILALISMVGVRYFNSIENYTYSFFCSVTTIAILMIMVGIALFPNIIPALISTNSITIANASASSMTLTGILIVMIISVPIILIYTAFLYKVFIFKKVDSEISHY